MHSHLPHDVAFGYLSTVHSIEHGYFGGYLTVSQLGRPLEFHFTAPVQPSRAQHILYGPTLEPFLLGEQIASSLFAAMRTIPKLILTDSPHFESATAPMGVPLVLVGTARLRQNQIMCAAGPALAPDDSSKSLDVANAAVHPAWSQPFSVGDVILQLPAGRDSQRGVVTELIAVLADRVEISEPFERIQEAIREAQRIGARGGDAIDRAA